MMDGISVVWRNREHIEEHVGSNITVPVLKNFIRGWWCDVD
jgi:hypothetical protein